MSKDKDKDKDGAGATVTPISVTAPTVVAAPPASSGPVVAPPVEAPKLMAAPTPVKRTQTVLFFSQQMAKDVEVPEGAARSRPGALRVLPGRSVSVTTDELAALKAAGATFRLLG